PATPWMGGPGAGVIPLANSARFSKVSIAPGSDPSLGRRRFPYRPGIQSITIELLRLGPPHPYSGRATIRCLLYSIGPPAIGRIVFLDRSGPTSRTERRACTSGALAKSIIKPTGRLGLKRGGADGVTPSQLQRDCPTATSIGGA